MQYSKFVINETPYCVWEPDIRAKNLAFIEGIDPAYFDHIVNIYKDMLEGEERQYAALALRTAYSHALETFFALLCSTIQAPDCVVGWLLRYQIRELQELVLKIEKKKVIYSKFKIKPFSWEEISALINRPDLGSYEEEKKLKKLWGKLWNRFARDFLDDKRRNEFNSIKHGLRTTPGGFSLAVGEEEKPNSLPPISKMGVLGGSVFGSTFFMPERFNKYNFSIKQMSINWYPENSISALKLLSMSINNITSFLKSRNGVDSNTLKSKMPNNYDDFNAPWENYAAITSMVMNPIIKEADIQLFDKDEILKIYSDENEEV